MSLSNAMAGIDIEMQKYRNLIEMLENNAKGIRADNAALKRLVALKKKYRDLQDENDCLIAEYHTLVGMVNS